MLAEKAIYSLRGLSRMDINANVIGLPVTYVIQFSVVEMTKLGILHTLLNVASRCSLDGNIGGTETDPVIRQSAVHVIN